MSKKMYIRKSQKSPYYNMIDQARKDGIHFHNFELTLKLIFFKQKKFIKKDHWLNTSSEINPYTHLYIVLYVDQVFVYFGLVTNI